MSAEFNNIITGYNFRFFINGIPVSFLQNFTIAASLENPILEFKGIISKKPKYENSDKFELVKIEDEFGDIIVEKIDKVDEIFNIYLTTLSKGA